MKRTRLAAVAASAMTIALALSACGNGDTASPDTPAPETTAPEADAPETEAPEVDGVTITMWVAGADTPQELRDWLIENFAAQNPGATLVIEEQGWGDLVPQLTTALPDPNNTPDVVEIGNTQAPTFTSVGAFRPISDALFQELGGSALLPSFVEAGTHDGQIYALPYYFGSRYMFYRSDIWTEAGLSVPSTLGEFTESAAALRTGSMSGFAIGGQDWRNGISWVFAHDGDLARFEDGAWVSTLSDPNTVAGLTAWQELFTSASNLPATDRDVAYWDFINDGVDGEPPLAATIMAPGWARWSIGPLNEAGDGRENMADFPEMFDIFALPGVNGGIAPVFAGGSNVAISAQSQHPELAENLLRLIFSADYQRMLGANGLGPANENYADSMGDDKFARTMIETAFASRLTPAAPGWAAIEGALVYEELFQAIAEGGDVAAIAAEFDARLTPMLNGN
ncbi:MAG: extracellular solute-binding protein [Promicromonosporaceae bacterium]|nr:extracellular solute-binding protein [Promicromonosporaceae bacterium]